MKEDRIKRAVEELCDAIFEAVMQNITTNLREAVGTKSPGGRFDNGKMYHPGELISIATKKTLKRWRLQGRGPHYLKVGGRILYHGRAINEWLAVRDRT